MLIRLCKKILEWLYTFFFLRSTGRKKIPQGGLAGWLWCKVSRHPRRLLTEAELEVLLFCLSIGSLHMCIIKSIVFSLL